MLAYTTALDRSLSYEEKAPFIEDPEGLEGTVETYNSIGDQMGGVGVMPTAVVIDGDTAEITYDILFGGNPSYPGQVGDAVKTADGWKITKESFCALMTLARGGCPAE